MPTIDTEIWVTIGGTPLQPTSACVDILVLFYVNKD